MTDMTVDLSYSKRKETDIQGFGGQVAYTRSRKQDQHR